MPNNIATITVEWHNHCRITIYRIKIQRELKSRAYTVSNFGLRRKFDNQVQYGKLI